MTCASIKRLCEIKDVTPEIAKKVRFYWNNPKAFPRDLRMKLINALIETHGVEYLGQHKRTGSQIEYCNAGDVYATTILFEGDHLRVGCWGDLAERNMVWDANDERRPGWPN